MSLPLTADGVVYRIDDSDHIRFINQLAHPYEDTDAGTAKELADSYILDSLNDWELESGDLELSNEPSINLNNDFVELYFLGEYESAAFHNVFYTQAYFGIPLWTNCLNLTIRKDDSQVIRAASNLSYEEVTIPTNCKI